MHHGDPLQAVPPWITVVYHAPMSREDPQMKIRLPADLKDQIDAAAKQSGRSMNAEIVARLENSFGTSPELKSNTSEATKLLDELVALIERKRKNQEVVDYLRETGLLPNQVAEAFERELHDIGYHAHTAAQRLIELGEADAVKQVSKQPSKKFGSDH